MSFTKDYHYRTVVYYFSLRCWFCLTKFLRICLFSLSYLIFLHIGCIHWQAVTTFHLRDGCTSVLDEVIPLSTFYLKSLGIKGNTWRYVELHSFYSNLVVKAERNENTNNKVQIINFCEQQKLEKNTELFNSKITSIHLLIFKKTFHWVTHPSNVEVSK